MAIDEDLHAHERRSNDRASEDGGGAASMIAGLVERAQARVEAERQGTACSVSSHTAALPR